MIGVATNVLFIRENKYIRFSIFFRSETDSAGVGKKRESIRSYDTFVLPLNVDSRIRSNRAKFSV